MTPSVPLTQIVESAVKQSIMLYKASRYILYQLRALLMAKNRIESIILNGIC